MKYCVSVVLPQLSGIQIVQYLSCAALYCHLWPVWLYHMFHIISQMARFSGQHTEHKMCVWILSTTFV